MARARAGSTFAPLAPVAWAVYTSLRPYAATNECGYVSVCGSYNFHNYTKVWSDAHGPAYLDVVSGQTG